MKLRKISSSLLASFAALCLATACSQEEGPAERAGKTMDQATEQASEGARESIDAAAGAAAEADDAAAAAAAYDEVIDAEKKKKEGS